MISVGGTFVSVGEINTCFVGGMPTASDPSLELTNQHNPQTRKSASMLIATIRMENFFFRGTGERTTGNEGGF